MRTHRTHVLNFMSLPKSLSGIKACINHDASSLRSECNATWQPHHRCKVKQSQTSASDRLNHRRLSASSDSSGSSGEFIPSTDPPVPVVSNCSASVNGVSATLSHSQLQSMSREELLSLLSRQQEEISLREAELKSLTSDIETLESLQSKEQSLNAKLFELEQLERTVDEELEELELVSWHDKLEMETNRCVQLEADAGVLKSAIARSQSEADQWQQRLGGITAETDTVRANSQQMEDNKTQLKEQLDKLELKLAECRCISHDRQSALQQIERTLESNAELVRVRIEEQLRLQGELETRATIKSHFQRSSSFDKGNRAKNTVRSRPSSTQRLPMGSQAVDVAFSCQI